MRTVKTMEVICITPRRGFPNIKVGETYYIDKTSIYTDEYGVAYGLVYNGAGISLWNLKLCHFCTTKVCYDLNVY